MLMAFGYGKADKKKEAETLDEYFRLVGALCQFASF
jgi:hypothetical protein